MSRIKENLEGIREALGKCAVDAGRGEDAVSLVAVSKTKPIEAVREAMAAGQMHFGENRVQELVEKNEAIPEAKWHMIGVLQRNKVKYIAPFIYLIHSVDSEKLAREVSKQAVKCGREIDVLLQINISDEPQKGGFEEDEAEEMLGRIADFPNVKVCGLMGMAEFTADMEVVRGQFKRLAAARERFKSLEGSQVAMRELSMGMSGDYPVAIEEGATLVRIGSAIFGHR